MPRRLQPLARCARHAAAAAMLAAAGGCGMEAADAPPCEGVVPAAAEILRDPAFGTLRYHKRMNYEVVRGAGYDVWGDQRFEYSVGLQFTLVPRANARNDDQLCARAVALRLAMPADEEKRSQLRAFVRAVARHSGLDEERLRAQILERLARAEKLRPTVIAGEVAVEAGVVTHPWRGDFFVVSFGRPAHRDEGGARNR